MARSPNENTASYPRFPFWARVSWLWFLAALFIASYTYFNIVSIRNAQLIDFHVYWEALDHAAHGQPIYALNSPMPFLYPPFFLIVLWPLGWLSEPAAMTVWLHLQSVFVVVSLVALLAAVRPLDPVCMAASIILFCGYSPVMLNALYGQANLLYLALLSLSVLGYARSIEERPGSRVWEFVAALTLSAAISIRILPLALLAMAAIQRRYRLALWTLVLVVVEAVAAGARMGFATEWDYFTSYLLHLRGLENMREISLLALLDRLAGSRTGPILFVLAVAVGLAVFFALVYRPMRHRAASPVLPVAFVLASMVLFAPLLEYHHYTLLLAPFVLVLGDLSQRGRLSLARAMPVLFAWAIISAANQLSHFRYGAIAFFALAGALLIWVYLIGLIAEDQRPPESPPASQRPPS